MNVIDNILLEWSYRCPDGIVDMSDPKKAKILKEILKPILKEDIDDDILNALSRLDPNDPKKEKILTYITGGTKDERDQEIEKLKQQIDGSKKEKEEIAQELLSIEKKLISKNLKESMVDSIIYSFLKANKEKDLINYFNLDTEKTKLNVKDEINIKETPLKYLPKDIIEKLYKSLSGSSGTKGVGKEENFLVAFYNNVSKAEKKGDIVVDNQKYEVKGVGAMVTPSDIGRGSKKDVIQLLSSEFFPNIDISQLPEEIFQEGIRWIDTISDLYKKYPDKSDFINKLQSVLSKKYPNLEINDSILKDPNIFTKEIAKNLISSFDVSNEEKIMFIDPDGKIKIYNTKNDLIKDIDSGEIRISSFSDFVPRLTLPKKKPVPQKTKIPIWKEFVNSFAGGTYVNERWIRSISDDNLKKQFDCSVFSKPKPKFGYGYCLLKPNANIELELTDKKPGWFEP